MHCATSQRMSPNTTMTSFRLGTELLARLDLYAERLASQSGVPVSRAAALTKLLTERLDQVQPKAGPKPKK